jgi:glutathione S-transferase
MTLPTAPLTLCELADPGIPGVESYSPFCVKVNRALRLAGLAYTREHGERPGVFKKYNPAGQVPVLLEGERAIFDSTEILRQIEAWVPGSMTGEGDAATKAEAWLWEDYADACLNGFLVASRWADDRNWPSVRAAYFAGMPAIVRMIVPGRLRARVVGGLVARDIWRAGPERCWARFQSTLDELDARAPRKGFWLGSAPTAADVALFGQLHSLRTALTPWQREQVGKRSALTSYLDRVDQRTRLAEGEGLAKAA